MAIVDLKVGDRATAFYLVKMHKSKHLRPANHI